MQKINVSVVSYANSVPFVYGLWNSDIINEINLSLDIPSVCADKLIGGTVDIGLIPTVEVLRMNTYEIVSDLCIGSNDFVKTVILASDVPVNKITGIRLDYQSRTSVVLVKVLAKYFWKINPEWIPTQQGFEEKAISGSIGTVIIGDRAFSVRSNYRYDLAHEWKEFTNLPFVFATWTANKILDKSFIQRFNQALNLGIQNLDASAKFHKSSLTTNVDLLDYLKNNVNFKFDGPKQKAREMFLTYAKDFVDCHKLTSL